MKEKKEEERREESREGGRKKKKEERNEGQKERSEGGYYDVWIRKAMESISIKILGDGDNDILPWDVPSHPGNRADWMKV